VESCDDREGLDLRLAASGTTLKQLRSTLVMLRDSLTWESPPSAPAVEPSPDGQFEVLVDPIWRIPIARMLRRPQRNYYHTTLFWMRLMETLANTVANASLAPDVGILFDYRDQCVDDGNGFFDARMLEGIAASGSGIAGRQRGHWGMLIPPDINSSTLHGGRSWSALFGETLTFRVFVEEDEARRWVARDEFPDTT
jgi:hypothetical protein